MHILQFIISFAVITLLFAAMFKVMPDAIISWSDIWVGAIVTALLFVGGKYALAFYLGSSNPGDAFGAAGSLALILVWQQRTGSINQVARRLYEACRTLENGSLRSHHLA